VLENVECWTPTCNHQIKSHQTCLVSSCPSLGSPWQCIRLCRVLRLAVDFRNMPTSSNETDRKPGCSCIQPCVYSTHLWICSFTCQWVVVHQWEESLPSFVPRAHSPLPVPSPELWLHKGHWGCGPTLAISGCHSQPPAKPHTNSKQSHMFFCMHLSALISMHRAHVPDGNMMGIPRHPKSTRAIIQIMTESARNRKRMHHFFGMQTSLSYFHFCIFIFLLVILVVILYTTDFGDRRVIDKCLVAESTWW